MPNPENHPKEDRATLSDRRFRRYHRAAERKRRQAREDSHFFSAVFSLAGVSAALAIGLAIYFLGGGSDLSGFGSLAKPWIGPFSRLEVIGIGIIAVMGATYLWRVRKRK